MITSLKKIILLFLYCISSECLKAINYKWEDTVLREDEIMRKDLSLVLLSHAGLCPLVSGAFARIKRIVLLVFPESKGSEGLNCKSVHSVDPVCSATLHRL